MSIQSEINRLKQAVSDAFTAIGNKGGTVPSSKVSGNLSTAIDSIPTGATVQHTSGDFTTTGTADISSIIVTSVECGFMPDVVRISTNETYGQYLLETAADFYGAKADAISGSLYVDWEPDVMLLDYFIDRTATGFTFSCICYDYAMGGVNAENLLFSYSATKFT